MLFLSSSSIDMLQTFDAGLHFSLMRVEYEGEDDLGWKAVVSNPEGVQHDESARWRRITTGE